MWELPKKKTEEVEKEPEELPIAELREEEENENWEFPKKASEEEVTRPEDFP